MNPVVSGDSGLVDAVNGDRLAVWADAVLRDPTSNMTALAEHVASTCARIGSDNEADHDRLRALLASDGIEVRNSSVSNQRHTILLDIDAGDAPVATEVLERHGYQRESHWTGGAARSFWRHAGTVTLTATDARTSVVRIRWRAPQHSGRPTALVRSAVIPTAADWNVITLPSRLSWAYVVVRPVRLLLERIGLRSRDHASLEPFLATPLELLEPLFDLADVDTDDVLADIGCGDGRIVVRAVQNRSCRAIGIEQSERLVTEARSLVRRAGVGDRARIVHGDATRVGLDDVTVAVLFVPMVVARRLLVDLLERLPTGAQVLLHEQSPLASDLPPPTTSHAVIAENAVTVAYRWIVEAGG